MVDSHFQVQLTAVLDVLMKSAVADICALTESWFKSLHLEITKSKQENEDLRQTLQLLQQDQQLHQPCDDQQHQSHQQPAGATDAEEERSSTKVEEEEEHSEREGRPQDGLDAGCTVSGTSAEGKQLEEAADVQLWSTAPKASNTQSAPFKRGSSRWKRTPVGAKCKLMDRSGNKRLNEMKRPCCDQRSESKNQLEKMLLALPNPQCSAEVGTREANEGEGHAVLNIDHEVDGLQHKREEQKIEEQEEEQFDVILLTPNVQCNSTPHLRENPCGLTNPGCRQSSLGREVHLTIKSSNSTNLDISEAAAALTSGQGTTFICNVCGKNLASKNSFTSHYRLHTGEKPFVCTHCGKQFAKKFNLNIHYNIHTGAKPYICSFCTRSFADPSAFRRHKWIHRQKSQQSSPNTKGKFCCSICGKCFFSRPSLFAHFRQCAAEKHGVQKVSSRKLHYKLT